MPFRTTIKLSGSVEAKARELNSALRKSFEKVGGFWHNDILPKHFTTAGAREYGFQKRDKKYMKRKARKFHHQRPNVFSGKMELAIESRVEIRATKKGAKLKMHGPKYLFQFRKDFNQPDKAAEITAVSDKDQEAMAKRIEKEVVRNLNNIRKG